MSRQDPTDALRALVDAAARVVFFTGAGISTESGIPDFRSPGTGLWTKIKPIEFQDFVASEAVRRESWRRRFEGERVMERAKPNAGHLAIARLVAEGKVTAVITQNVDNLHQDSGVPAEQVIELHGNASYARCLDCALRYEMADLEAQFRSHGNVAPCSRCGGIVKSATISFGQAMPEREMERAQAAVEACDLCVVAGSSLVVYPAAGFPEYAKRLGAGLAIVNREETPLDRIADVVVHGELGPTLAYVAGINAPPAAG
jgi:NAD-dependent deacetylase